MDRENNRNKWWLILLVPLMIAVGVLTWQRMEQQRRQRQELHEAQLIAKMRENPLIHVRKGTDVAVVERALGRGERRNVDGTDVRVWRLAGEQTFVATIKDGKVDHTSMTSGDSGHHASETAVRLHMQSPRARKPDQAKLPERNRAERGTPKSD